MGKNSRVNVQQSTRRLLVGLAEAQEGRKPTRYGQNVWSYSGKGFILNRSGVKSYEGESPRLKGNMETTEAARLAWRDKRLQVRHASARQGNLPSRGPMAHCKQQRGAYTNARALQTPVLGPKSAQTRSRRRVLRARPSVVRAGASQ